jgi:hypothetical protein
MWSFTRFFNPDPTRPRGVHDAAYRDDVGYGTNIVGGMLSIKQYDNDKSDLELAEVRKTAGILP